MTKDDALIHLARATAESVAATLRGIYPGEIESGNVVVVPADTDPLEYILPAVAVEVSYVDGVAGGNLFAISHDGARKLAAAMLGTEPEPESETGELGELVLSSVGEAMNQMISAAAAATSTVLGQEVEIGTPTTHFLKTPEEAHALLGDANHVTTAALSLDGSPCRLVQLVPNAFVVRMTRALDALSTIAGPDSAAAAAGGLSPLALRSLPVHVSAELGGARLPLGRAIGLARGAVVELDRRADDPIELFVNGRRFATGRLLLVDDDEWAVEIAEVFRPEHAGSEADDVEVVSPEATPAADDAAGAPDEEPVGLDEAA
jgi:flagellar motor switch protein FliN/FliY